MSVRPALLASVCAAFLAASAAVSGPAAATPENSYASLAREAYKALTAGDAAGAIASYSTAIESRELEPEVLANALLNRALAYQNTGDHPKAIDDYTAALRLDAMSGKLRAMALYNRALSYQKVQRPALAMEDYTGALFLDSSFAHAYYGRGNLLRDSGQYLFALADYEKALENRYPEAAKVYYNQALTFEVLQRPDNMRQSLSKALDADPDYAPAKTRLAALINGAPIHAAALSPQKPGGTLVARKSMLPEAQVPSASLLAGQTSPGDATASVTAPSKKLVETAAVASTKKIEDRIPAEVQTTASIEAPAEEPAEEKIVAIEPVTEEMVAEAPAGEPASAVQKGWSVQIASAASEDAAWSTWKKMQKRYKVLKDKEPVVIKADLGSKGTFYRLRFTGYDQQDQAKSACSRLKSGGVKCYVSKADS